MNKKLLFILAVIISFNSYAEVGSSAAAPYIGKAVSKTYNASAIISGTISDDKTRADLVFNTYVFSYSVPQPPAYSTAHVNINYNPASYQPQDICAKGIQLSHDGTCSSNLTLTNCKLVQYANGQALEGDYVTETPSACAKPDTGWLSIRY